MGETLHAGHRKRMRSRIDKCGISSLEDHELLEFLLFYVIPRKNTNPLAHDLINHFGSLRKVLTASGAELEEFGLSKRAAFWISHINDFIDYYAEMYYEDEDQDPEANAMEWIKKDCKDLPPGKLFVVALDNTGFAYHAQMFNYNHRSMEKNVANVCKTALRVNAFGIVLAQTYEEDHFTPEKLDCEETVRYAYSLSVFNVSLVERIHVSGGNYTAYSKLGAFCTTEDELERNAYYRLICMEGY